MDLQTIFSAVCNMTITAGLVIGCVLLARLALGKAPRGFVCALWLVVLFRLLCPVAPSGPVSVLSIVDAPKAEAPVSTVTYVRSPVQAPVETIHADPSQGVEATPSVRPAEPPIDWHLIAASVWAAGVIALTAYGFLSYVNLKRKLRASVALGSGIREADGIASPFVLGLFRPVIYLPSGMGEERGYILLHERCHIRHGDHLLKGLFWLAVCLHWFNPLAWVAFTLCGRDMELRCDETVLRDLGEGIRSDYAQSLLDFSAGRRMAPAALAFGEGDTGKRVRHVLGWKRKAVWALIPAAVLCAVVLLITAVNPGGMIPESPFGHSYKAATVVPTRYDTPVEQEQLYTLTSDMALFVRSGQNIYMEGSFKKLDRVPASCAAFPDPAEWAMLRSGVEYAWEANGYLLLQFEEGDLYLVQGETAYHLKRTDLLGVSIKQPGIESYVEPEWYRSGEWNWMSDEMSATLLRGDAQIVLMPEKDVAQILVEEEYHDGSGAVTVSHHVLEQDRNGDFLLDVPHRGSKDGNFSVYRVTMGEDTYVFRIRFADPTGDPAPEEPTREVTFTQDNAFITLQLPESWAYSVVSPDAEELDAGITGGISFWPRGREEGKVFFGYYPDLFAVCGTGLESTAMTLAGQAATVGTYDGKELWDFIRFSDYFAVWGQGHETWWAEYGDQAMEILDSAVFSEQRIDLSELLEGEPIYYFPASPTEP